VPHREANPCLCLPISPGAKNHFAFTKSFFAFAKIIFAPGEFYTPKKYSKKYRKTLDNRCPDVVSLHCKIHDSQTRLLTSKKHEQ